MSEANPAFSAENACAWMPGKVTLGIAGSRIRHVFCKQCGTIVYSQVADTRGFSPYRPAG